MEKEKRFTSRNNAKSIIDTLFDKKLLREDVTRDQMNVLEDLLDYMMESSVKSWCLTENLLKSLKKSEATH